MRLDLPKWSISAVYLQLIPKLYINALCSPRDKILFHSHHISSPPKYILTASTQYITLAAYIKPSRVSHYTSHFQYAMASTTSSTNNRYLKAGLGSSDNYHLVDDLPPYVPYEMPRKISTANKFASGIGGAGNFHCVTEQASISSSDSIRRARLRRDNSPRSFHFGIGGSGNRASRVSSSSSSSSSRQSSPPPPPPAYAPSAASSHTTMDGFDRIKARISAKIGAKIAARNSKASVFKAWQRKLPTYPDDQL